MTKCTCTRYHCPIYLIQTGIGILNFYRDWPASIQRTGQPPNEDPTPLQTHPADATMEIVSRICKRPTSMRISRPNFHSDSLPIGSARPVGYFPFFSPFLIYTSFLFSSCSSDPVALAAIDIKSPATNPHWFVRSLDTLTDPPLSPSWLRCSLIYMYTSGSIFYLRSDRLGV